MTSSLPQFNDTVQDTFDVHHLTIETQNRSQLIVQQRLKLWSYIFVALWSILFAGIPAGLAIWVSSQMGISRLSCQQNAAATFDCNWSQRQFWGLGPEADQQVIPQVVDAELETAQWSSGEGTGTEKTWVTLLTASDRIRLFEKSYAIESGFQPTFQPEAVAEIKQLITSETDEFAITENTRWSPQSLGTLLLATPFLLIGVLVAYITLRSRTLTLDRINHRYIREVNTLFGTRVEAYPLEDIQSVTIKEIRRHTDRRVRRTYHLEVNLSQNRQHRFPGLRQRQRVSEVVVQMRSFIQ